MCSGWEYKSTPVDNDDDIDYDDDDDDNDDDNDDHNDGQIMILYLGSNVVMIGKWAKNNSPV